MNNTFWRGRSVLITGHTGFKGSWLALTLHRLGAKITGYALPPTDAADLFVLAGVDRHLNSVLGDVRDVLTLKATAVSARPDVIFHLAAQALVLPSYEQPIDTFATNVMGTANVLEAARSIPSVRAIVVVTSDKVYRNHAWPWPYRENDELGGRDPYSTSKACAELVSSSYRDSFFSGRGVGVATARAGNVIGGGDWAVNRIVPDFVRATIAGRPLNVRNPQSVRPWQHVLDPVRGYILLGERLVAEPDRWAQAWNFGPSASALRSVGRLASDLTALWGEGASWSHESAEQPHEASLLTLESAKARDILGWAPRLDYDGATRLTIDWYKTFSKQGDAGSVAFQQIEEYLR